MKLQNIPHTTHSLAIDKQNLLDLLGPKKKNQTVPKNSKWSPNGFHMAADLRAVANNGLNLDDGFKMESTYGTRYCKWRPDG